VKYSPHLGKIVRAKGEAGGSPGNGGSTRGIKGGGRNPGTTKQIGRFGERGSSKLIDGTRKRGKWIEVTAKGMVRD